MRTAEYVVLTILAIAAALWLATTVASSVSNSLNNSAALIEKASR